MENFLIECPVWLVPQKCSWKKVPEHFEDFEDCSGLQHLQHQWHFNLRKNTSRMVKIFFGLVNVQCRKVLLEHVVTSVVICLITFMNIVSSFMDSPQNSLLFKEAAPKHVKFCGLYI